MRYTRQAVQNVQFCVLIGILGVISSTLSSTADHMAGAFHQPGSAVGTYISVFFLGCLVSVPFGGILADWKGKRRIVLIAAGLLCIGMFMVFLSVRALPVYIGLFFIGVGFGPCESLSSAYLADENPGRATRWLNISQVGFCIGAIAAPLWAAWYFRQSDSSFQRLFAAIGSAVVLLVVSLLLSGRRSLTPVKTSAFQGNIFSVLRDRRMLLLAVMIFLYLGIESVVPAYTKQLFLSAGNSEAMSSIMISVFWGSMIISRFIGIFLDGKEIPSIKILLLVLIAAVAIVLAARQTWMRAIGVLLLGFGCGPIWPMLVSLAARISPDRSGAACSIMMLFSTAGATMFPTLIGTWVGNVRITFILCALLALLCLPFAAAARNSHVRQLQP